MESKVFNQYPQFYCTQQIPKYRSWAFPFITNKIVCIKKNYCKINLEVRKDNLKVMNLYRKMGFTECNSPTKFWECSLIN